MKNYIPKPQSAIRLAIYSLLLIGIYWATYSRLIGHDWLMDDYSFCMMIPLVVLYLIWEKKEELAAVPAAVSWNGLFLLLPGIVLFWVGDLAGEYYTSYLSSWLVAMGLLWLHNGRRKLEVVAFGLFMLLAMFPLPNFFNTKITFSLKLISSQLGVDALQLYGMTAYREGNVIDLGFTKLQVVDACSGLRYMFPLLIMGLLLAYFYKARLWKKVVLVVSTIPLTIITNSLRIAATGVLYEIWGPAVAEDFFHGFSGWLIFIFGLGVLLLEMVVLSGFRGLGLFGGAESKDELATDPHGRTQTFSPGDLPEEKVLPASPDARSTSADAVDVSSVSSGGNLKPNTSNLKPHARIGMAALLHPPQFIVAVALLAATLAAAHGIEFREKVPPAQSFESFPLQVGDWKGKRDVMDDAFIKELDFSDYVIVDYAAGPRSVNFYTAYYESQRKGESIHSPETCIPGSGWEFKNAGSVTIPLTAHPGSTVHGSTNPGSTVHGSRSNGSSITVNRAVMEKGASRQLVYFWFPQRDRVLTNAWQLKLYNFWDALTRQRTDGALVRLITPVYPDEDAGKAEQRLTSFTQDIVPVLNQYLPK